MVDKCLPIGRCAVSETKERILAAATRRFAHSGFDGTSLSHIADDVGMRKPSLLYHFPSKESLREAVLNQLLGQWQTRLPDILARAHSVDDRFGALFDEVHDFFSTDPSRALLVMREVVDRPAETRTRLGDAIRPWARIIASSIEAERTEGRVHRSADPEAYVVQSIVMMIGSVVAADFSAAVFGASAGPEWSERQRTEARRIARFSLFHLPGEKHPS